MAQVERDTVQRVIAEGVGASFSHVTSLHSRSAAQLIAAQLLPEDGLAVLLTGMVEAVAAVGHVSVVGSPIAAPASASDVAAAAAAAAAAGPVAIVAAVVAAREVGICFSKQSCFEFVKRCHH